MAKERKPKKNKEKKVKEKKGRITRKGKEILNRELEKIEAQKHDEAQQLIGLSRSEKKEKKVAEKLRKKIIEHFERRTLMIGVDVMNMDLKKGSKEKTAAREKLINAKNEENEVKNMNWRELIEKYGDMTFDKNTIDEESDEEYDGIACS